MARFAVGLSLCLLVSSFSFAQSHPLIEILPCSYKLAEHSSVWISATAPDGQRAALLSPAPFGRS
jgi:hypothetical protein